MIVYNSTNYSAAPSGSIWKPVTRTDASGSGLSLGQTLPVAKSALSQWQPGPTFKEHKAIVYKRYLEGKTKSTSICLINTCQICVIESYDIVYSRHDCV